MPASSPDPLDARSSRVFDVVLLPPSGLAARAVRESRLLAEHMRRAGNPSHFLLDGPDPDGGPGVCAPHVSIFMFAATAADLPAALRTLHEVAGAAAPVAAVGSEYAHNPHGAPELYFERSPAWFDLQRRVVAAFEPLRRGRQREFDPAGTPLAGVLGDHGATGAARRRQLLTYGYDEITDDTDDHFRPHITLAWPERAEPAVELASLPAASTARGTFDRLAVYGMSAWGTCTAPYDVVPLTGPRGRVGTGSHWLFTRSR
ncbi:MULTISPECIES: hypothetical protein [Frankia]|nr:MULTISPECIES: hypothetical protein [Frankia]